MLELVIIIVAVALLFDFLNGLNDAANSIATIVSTRVLKPRTAVLWAAWWNFAAAFGFGVSIATTIGKGIVDASIVSEGVILGALIGAIVWTAVASFYGLPISVSHSLIGGLLGAGVAKAGTDVIVSEGISKVLLFIALSPIFGLLVGFALMATLSNIFRHSVPAKVNRHFRRFQLISGAAYSFGHGTNDAQKTMGIIAILLFSSGYLGPTFYVPVWVILAAHAAIALGTLIGGWRVVRTMGMKLTHLTPQGGFSAETAAALTLVGTAYAGIPVSTTHTIAGGIMGVGSTRRLSAVRWGIARRIVVAWILTIPMTAGIAALSYMALASLIP
tara:strand:- start:134 stop:1126 length:993 start_codon:yes stop_codon:yes gene_type:complete